MNIDMINLLDLSFIEAEQQLTTEESKEIFKLLKNSNFDIESIKSKNQKINNFLQSCLKTQQIHQIQGKGSPNSTETKMSDLDKDFLKNHFGTSSGFERIKSQGYIDDAHTSRFSISYNESLGIIVKYVPDPTHPKSYEQIAKEVTLNKKLVEQLKGKTVKIQDNVYDLKVPQIIDYPNEEYVIYEYITNDIKDPYLLQTSSIEVYSQLKDLFQDFNVPDKYSFDKWNLEFIEVCETLKDHELAEIDTKKLESEMEKTKDIFEETECYVHGDTKLSEHLIIHNDNAYLLDHERNLFTTYLYDATGLSTRTLREGVNFLSPFIYSGFDITKDQLPLFMLFESFVILREYMRVFTNKRMATSSITIIPEKKFRDFSILNNKTQYNLDYLNINNTYTDLQKLFTKFHIEVIT